MIAGVGCDIVDLNRFRRVWSKYPRRLPARILTAREQSAFAHRPGAEYLGARWAAKEALIKALGRRLPWRGVGALNDDGGRPFFAFLPPLADDLRRAGIGQCHLSISHHGDYVMAMVVAERLS